MSSWATYSYEVNRSPRSARSLVSSFLRSSYLTAASLQLKFATSPGLRCLYCHNIFDDQATEFRKICVELKRTGTFIDTDTCIKMLNAELPIDGTYYHLSFDDGFRNILYNGLPVMQELSIPAVVFVVTDLIDASYGVVSEYCSTRWSVYARPIQMLSWSDLAELQQYGVTIGSHTRTHRRLSTLSTHADLVDEIAHPKLQLEEGLGKECRFISWPYGRLADTNQQSLSFIRESGYTACFGGYRGSVKAGATDPFLIPRHHFEPDWPLNHVRLFASGRAG